MLQSSKDILPFPRKTRIVVKRNSRLVPLSEFEKEKRDLSGPCEDDYETKCPYIGILPDESENEDGSPLRFRPEF